MALPTMLYFLWSPITDFLVRRRTWLLIGSLGAAGFMLFALRERDLTSASALTLIFLSACFCQLVVSSCGGMMGAFRLERSKRVASSFYQGGSMGFGAASVWVLLKASERTQHSVLGIAAALLIGVPGLFALAAPKQEMIVVDTFGATLRRLWIEFKATFGRWEAVPYTLLMLFPMASGAAVGLLSAVAKDYGVNGGQVGWINGLLGALLTAVGALVAAILPANVRATVMYLSLALVNAGTLCVLWLGPLTQTTYFIGVMLYLFTVGMCYALFTAVVLEFLGSSGKSGSGRYSIINSMGNVPVLYMIVVDGWGASRWGSRGLAGTEAVVGGIGAAVLLSYFALFAPRKTTKYG
jgi:PAT family beta-lactamase induction signal transducer AmpG